MLFKDSNRYRIVLSKTDTRTVTSVERMHPRRHDIYENTDNLVVCPPAVRDLGSCPEHITQQHRFDRQHRPDGHNAIHQQFTDKREFSNEHHYRNQDQQSAIGLGGRTEFNRHAKQQPSGNYF